MVKHFNIIMAGVISGIVALFTSFLGISGTIIGSVLSSFLYQLLSAFYEEKTKNIDFSNVGKLGNVNKSNKFYLKNNSLLTHKLAFVFPIVVILLIECLFCLTYTHYGFLKLFNLLEAITDQNLFRVMGMALIVISLYPLFKSDIVKRINFLYLFIVGVLLLFRGLIDIHPLFLKIFYSGLDKLDFFFAIFVVIILIGVSINVLKDAFLNVNITKSNKNFVPKKIKNNVDKKVFNKINPYIYNQKNSNDLFVDEYGENIPIYEEDYIYVKDPNNPNKPVKKRILKKVNLNSDKNKFNK